MTTSTSSPPITTPTNDRARWLALTTLCASMLMIVLDSTIVTVALPAIQTDLNIATTSLGWVINAYLIAFGGLLLLAGRLGDLLGRRRVFITGLTLFTLASLLCGIATTPTQLITARFLQGIGGALTSAVSLGMLVTLFPEPHHRAKAIGAFSFVSAAGASIGLISGGILTQTLSWPWIFLVNLPIGIAAILLALRLLPADPGIGLRQGADILGALLVTSGLMLGVYTIVETTNHGWTSPRTLTGGAIALALLTGFTLRQATAPTPLLPLRILTYRPVWSANLIQILMASAGVGFQVLIALYSQQVLGYDALKAGLALTPTTLLIGAFSLLLSARLITRYGARTVLLISLTLPLAAFCLLTRIPTHASYLTDLLPTLVLVSGFGLAFPALTNLAMSNAQSDDAGLTSGLFNTTQTVGSALGIAILSTIATTRTTTLLTNGEPIPDALASGHRLAYTTATAFIAAAILLTFALLRATRTPPTTHA